MLKLDDACNRLSDLIALARAGGADAADAIYVGSASTEVQMRLGKLEDVGRSEGEEIGLRVFVGQRTASVTGCRLYPDIVKPAIAQHFAISYTVKRHPTGKT